VFGLDQSLAGIHQEEAAGAVGAFGLALGKTRLPEQRGVLVAERGGDLDAWHHSGGPAVDLCGRPDLRQHLGGNVEEGQQLGVPGLCCEVHQHGATGVGHVRHVQSAADAPGQVPDQPGVHGAEQHIATFGPLPQIRRVVQQPAQFGRREVGG
jgi:hypothetical protein